MEPTETMRALVVDGDAVGRIAIGKVSPPQPDSGQVLVDVHAVSLNRGEMRMLRSAPPGLRPGWDFAGVLRDDVDERLRAGERVVGITPSGSWAEQVAVRGAWLAPIPAGVSFEQAAVVPTAGLTALRTLRMAGVGVGDHVLVTAAAGGVGRFAVQLAALGGAHVTALVTDDADAAGLRTLGASSVVTTLESVDGQRFDAIIESIGGGVLGRCFTMLDPRGSLVTFGNSSDESTTFNVRDVYNDALVKIFGFELFFDPMPFGPDLGRLMTLVAEGRLNPHLVDTFAWERTNEALARLDARRVGGKLALRIGRM